MAIRTWENLKMCYCERVAAQVSLDIQVVYPEDILPDQPPRVIAHRCSHAMHCNLDDRPSCMWSGTNPAYDPFKEEPL
jgi:hypothetical protein